MTNKYVVTLGGEVNFYPETVIDEVLQNVRTIISTAIGEVPLDRAFGVALDFLDSPAPVAKALLQAAIVDAIARYEPRAKVLEMTFKEHVEEGMEGRLYPVVTVTINEE